MNDESSDRISAPYILATGAMANTPPMQQRPDKPPGGHALDWRRASRVHPYTARRQLRTDHHRVSPSPRRRRLSFPRRVTNLISQQHRPWSDTSTKQSRPQSRRSSENRLRDWLTARCSFKNNGRSQRQLDCIHVRQVPPSLSPDGRRHCGSYKGRHLRLFHGRSGHRPNQTCEEEKQCARVVQEAIDSHAGQN